MIIQTDEQWEDEQDCNSQMALALVCLMGKFRQLGLEDCTEYDRASVALDRYERLQASEIERLDQEIKELKNDTTRD